MTRSPSVVFPPSDPDSPLADSSRPDRHHLLADLRAVVVALDARTVHPERAGESAIAADASALRLAALRRIDELERDDPAR